jgi:hypothetical protein
MIKIRQIISTYTSTRIFSLLLLLIVSATTHAQSKMFRMEKDSIPLFRGFAVSFDLVGPMMMALSDHGEIEGALRINLHDQWFPVFELGLGRANHENDEVTGITYKTTAPYFRVGMDWNIMKNKHADNRLYAGFRYGFTSYKLDIIREALPDPVWKNTSGFGKKDMGCSMHWLEAVFGIDAKIFGPLHLGWMVRYKRRIAHNDGDLGATWYVPGFGINDNDTFGANFNVIVDI